jgi:hypothetical protein
MSEFSHLGGMAAGICAPLLQMMFKLDTATCRVLSVILLSVMAKIPFVKDE